MLAIIKGGLKALGSLAWLSPALLWKRKRAMAIFKQHLSDQGLDHKTIEELSVAYKEMGNVQHWISEGRKE